MQLGKYGYRIIVRATHSFLLKSLPFIRSERVNAWIKPLHPWLFCFLYISQISAEFPEVPWNFPQLKRRSGNHVNTISGPEKAPPVKEWDALSPFGNLREQGPKTRLTPVLLGFYSPFAVETAPSASLFFGAPAPSPSLSSPSVHPPDLADCAAPSCGVFSRCFRCWQRIGPAVPCFMQSVFR